MILVVIREIAECNVEPGSGGPPGLGSVFSFWSVISRTAELTVLIVNFVCGVGAAGRGC